MEITDLFDNEYFQVRGESEIIAYSDDAMTQEIWKVHKKNLVVTLARRTMSRLIGGLLSGPTAEIETIGSGTVNVNSISDLIVQYMRWGDSGHDPSAPANGLPVAPATEGLNNTLEISSGVFEKPVTVDYPSDRSIRFSAALLKAEPLAQPVNLSEEGLFCGDPPIFCFAKINFGQLSKNNTFALLFRHTIVF